MNEIIEKCSCHIADVKKELTLESERLRAEERRDESRLCTVRASICDVIDALVRAAAKKCADADAAAEELNASVARVSAPWRARHETANAHGDFDTVCVEEAKIETAETLVRELTAIMKGTSI